MMWLEAKNHNHPGVEYFPITACLTHSVLVLLYHVNYTIIVLFCFFKEHVDFFFITYSYITFNHPLPLNIGEDRFGRDANTTDYYLVL